MSSHCNRYTTCGCTKEIGSKCQLPDGHPRLLEKEENNPRHIGILKVMEDLNKVLTPKNTSNRRNRRNLNKKHKRYKL